jgi:hypothetical protein
MLVILVDVLEGVDDHRAMERRAAIVVSDDDG